jgi:hypothetical protein
MGIHWQFGVVQGAGAAALSITLNTEALAPIDFTGSAGANVDTSSGDIDVTASAAGGDTSGDGYAYLWTLPDNGSSQLSVLAAGTQNTAQYNSLTLRGVPAAGPPAIVNQVITCQVTDDAGATAEVSITQVAIIAEG